MLRIQIFREPGKLKNLFETNQLYGYLMMKCVSEMLGRRNCMKSCFQPRPLSKGLPIINRTHIQESYPGLVSRTLVSIYDGVLCNNN